MLNMKAMNIKHCENIMKYNTNIMLLNLPAFFYDQYILFIFLQYTYLEALCFFLYFVYCILTDGLYKINMG